QWNFAGDTVMSGQSVVNSFPLAGVQPVSLTSQHQSGCSYTVLKNVTIHQTPLASFSPTVVYGAAPLSVTFSNSSVGATTYEWHFDGGGEVLSPSPTQVFHD